MILNLQTLFPKSIGSYLWVKALRSQGKGLHEEALGILREIEEIYPLRSYQKVFRGNVILSMGRDVEALKLYRALSDEFSKSHNVNIIYCKLYCDACVAALTENSYLQKEIYEKAMTLNSSKSLKRWLKLNP